MSVLKAYEPCLILVPTFQDVFGAKLAACCINASAPLLADGAVDAMVIEIEGEGFRVFIKRSLKWFFFDWVEWDQIDVAKDAAKSFREFLRTFDGVVHALDENVFEGDATTALFDVFLDCVKKDVHVVRS